MNRKLFSFEDLRKLAANDENTVNDIIIEKAVERAKIDEVLQELVALSQELGLYDDAEGEELDD